MATSVSGIEFMEVFGTGVLAYFFPLGPLEPKSIHSRLLKKVLPVVLLSIGVIVWAYTGKDPIQIAACFILRNAPECANASGAQAATQPVNASPAPASSQSTSEPTQQDIGPVAEKPPEAPVIDSRVSKPEVDQPIPVPPGAKELSIRDSDVSRMMGKWCSSGGSTTLAWDGERFTYQYEQEARGFIQFFLKGSDLFYAGQHVHPQHVKWVPDADDYIDVSTLIRYPTHANMESIQERKCS